MRRAGHRGGYALPVAIFMLVLAGAVVATAFSFVSGAARQTRVYLARNRCRFAAQSAVEQAKAKIQKGFSSYAGGSSAASVKIDPRQAEVYDWFDSVSGDRRTIGRGGKTVTLSDQTNSVNGCRIYVAIGRHVEHASNSSVAIVPIVATALYRYPDGLCVSSTIQERVIFGTGQSRVFDYAYFVNNYGWMNGSTITINGDMRANGDVSLSQSTVNGYIYAAANDELNVNGAVTLSGDPKIKSQSAYRSSAGSRARPDREDYNTSKSFDAPESGGIITARKIESVTDSQGNEVSVVVEPGTRGASGELIVNEESDSLPMPFVSELENYVAYAQEKQGRLTYPGYTYTDSLGASRTVSGGTVYAHYSGAGPSGEAGGADQGALMLVGTRSDPIVIDGPVVVDSDVIIKGYVKGQGTIYSGRNIHIVGDIQYVNAPSWRHPDGDDASVEADNAKRDMLGLVAKGNVVVGDSTSSSWHTLVDKYIKSTSSSSVVHSYVCDASDANIGYPSTFAGDYTAVEKVGSLSSELAAKAPGGYESASGQFGKLRLVTTQLDTYKDVPVYNWWGQGTKRVYDTVTELKASYDRRYYETVCDDALLSQFADSTVTQIDAIMYNNHGTFGTLGGNSRYSSYGGYVNVNGSLVCRDEALIYMANGLRFNWDFRLRSEDSTERGIGLPVGPQEPYTYGWMEVPDSLNPAFSAPEDVEEVY